VTATVRVATAEPVAAGGEAGIITRAIAFAADAIIIDVVAWLVGGAAAVIVSLFDLPSGVTNVLLAVGAAVAALWVVGYFVVFWSTTGQTPGNRMMRIRVRAADADASLSLGHALLRVAGAILSALILFLGFAMIIVEPRRRGLLDLIAGSVVVYVPPRT
jgi:uncharacterized RDD family membrane protein YckC